MILFAGALTVLFCTFLQLSCSFELDDLVQQATFPPPTDIKETDGEPKGHMKPLGWQRSPEGPIKEYTEALTANEFWKKHVRDHIPLVYRGYIKESPAIKNWNDDYLAKTYGDLDVLVEHKLEDRTSTSGRMKISDFLKNYKDQDLYVVSMFPTEMMAEVKAIPSIMCGTFKDYAHESNFWMSAGGTRSVVHFDADHNLHCMLSGRKDFMMINNNMLTKTNLYYKKMDPNSGSGYSFLDPDSIDMKKFKRIADVPWTYATLYPGDCIFIPSRYIHQVRGYGRTIAVTTLFTADIEGSFDGSGCTKDIMESYHSMAEIPFQWTYNKGDKYIDMGYMNVNLVKQRLRNMMADRKYTKTRSFTKKQFVKASGDFSPFARNQKRISKIWNDVFGLSDDSILDSDTLGNIQLDQWKIYIRDIEEAHGVVTNGSEPVFVRPGEHGKDEKDEREEDDEEGDEGDDGNDGFRTERERQLHAAAKHDPMLNHLSKEEKKEYIKKLKERKAMYGKKAASRPLEGINEVDDGVVNWVSELAWSMEEVPKKYQPALRAGRIPLEYKDEFLNSLSDVVKKYFEKDFMKNDIPKELVRELTNHDWDDGGDSEDGGGSQENGDLQDGDSQEGDSEEEDSALSLEEFPSKYHEELLAGKIPVDLKDDFMENLDDDMKERYKSELANNILPKEFHEAIISSSNKSEKDEDGSEPTDGEEEEGGKINDEEGPNNVSKQKEEL